MKNSAIMVFWVCIIVLIPVALSAATLSTPSFSWYSQRDPQWSSNLMGSSSYSLGSQGCAVTCVAMLHQAETSGQSSNTTPAQLNSWLGSNGGYSYSNGYALIIWSNAANYDGSQGLQYLSSNDSGDNWSYLDQQLNSGHKVIVKVDWDISSPAVDDHWVVVYAKNGPSGVPSSYSINDPWPTAYTERTLSYYYDPAYDNTFFASRTFSGTWNAPSSFVVSLSQNLGIYATRTNPATIYSLPNEYGSTVPTNDINTYYSYRIANTGTTGVTLEDTGVNYYNASGYMFRVALAQSVYLAPGGGNSYREQRVWITDQYTSNQTTTLTGKVAYKINGVWYELSGAGSSASFTVNPRPALSNGKLIKSPSSTSVYYYQYGYKWHIDSENDASLLSSNWGTETYIYPNSTVSGTSNPLTPSNNSTTPVFVGRNLIYKQSSNSNCYIIDSDPTYGGSLRSRKFQSEQSYYNYGYTVGSLASQSINVSSSAYSTIMSEYPLGSEIGDNLSVNPSNINVGYRSGSTSFSVTSNINWSVSENINWLTVSPTNGTGNGTVSVYYDANPNTTSRSGQITVSGSGLSQTITVTQDAATAALTVAPNSQNVSYSSGTTSDFMVTSNISWTVTESETWLSASPTSGNGNGSFTVNYDANPNLTPRTGQITVSGSGQTQTVTVVQAAALAVLTVAPNSQNVSYSSGTTSVFMVTSNITWTVTESETWLSASPTNGNGNGSFTVTFDANPNITPRTGQITVSGSGQTQTVTVVQAAAPPVLTVTPSSYNVSYTTGTTQPYTVTSNIAWTVTETETWLSASPTSGNGNGSFTVNYDANPNITSRTGQITISGSGLTQTVTVVQAAAPPALTVTPSSYNVSYTTGTTQPYTVTSNIAWTVTETETWLSASPTSGNGNGSFTVNYDANPYITSRTGQITVSGSGQTQTVTVVQAAAPPALTVTPSSYNVSYTTGTTQPYTVTSNIAWTVTETETWLSASPTSGNGNGSFTVNYDANPYITSRTGQITVSGSGQTQTVTVVQAAAPPALTVTPSSYNVSYTTGTTQPYTVTSNIAWTVTETETWLSASPTSGNGNGSFTVTYDANPNTTTRTGQITVSGSGQTQTVTVVQAAAPPALTVTPSSYNVSYTTGTTQPYTVTSNIAWTVTETETWLSASPTSGNGNGSFTVTYDANPNTTTRTGQITVSGSGQTQTVTVVQAAAPPSLVVTPSTINVIFSPGIFIWTVTSNINWSVSENLNWLTVSPTNGTGNGTVSVYYDANPNTTSRSGQITISGSGLSQTITVTQDAAPAVLTVTPSSYNVSYTSGTTQPYTVTSNIAWTVTESETWLSASPTSGNGSGSFTVNYDANPNTTSRTGQITVSGSGLTQIVTVTQDAAPPALIVTPTSYNVSYTTGTTQPYTVTSNIAWTVTESETWLSASPTSGNGSGSFTVNYDANPNTTSRTGQITVTGSGLTQIVTVTQDAAPPALIVTPTSYNVSYTTGTTQPYTVTSNIAWTVTETETWLSASPTSGNGNGSFTVTYDANPNTTTRTGQITVSGSGLTQTVTVVQAAAQAALTVTPSTRNVTSPAGTTTFDVDSNISWIVSESETWLSVNPMVGTNDNVLTVNYDANPTTSVRIGQITISGSGQSQAVTVVQAAAPATLTVTPGSQIVSYSSGTTTFDVASNISWVVSESDTWLSVNPMVGTNDNMLTVTYDANPTTSVRIGQITISGSGQTQTVTVTQGFPLLTLIVTPSIRNVTNISGTTTFDVASNISWIVSESETWLSVNPMVGTNDNVLTVTYDANLTTSTRIGQITISGSGQTQTVTVVQAASIPYLTVDQLILNFSATGNQSSFNIESNISWSLNIIQQGDWLSATPEIGNNDGLITVNCVENTETNPRTAQITISGEGLSQTINVLQGGSVENDDNISAIINPHIKNYPNPFSSHTTIEVVTKSKSDIELTVYTIKGQKIKTLGNTSKGVNNLSWDGKDINGKYCSNGCYIIRSNDKTIKPIKILLIR